MVVTKKYIQNLREKTFMDISEDAEKLILERFGECPVTDDNGCRHEYTEQDICEQIRKMIQNK